MDSKHDSRKQLQLWQLRKTRLERGQKVLSTLNETYFNVDEMTSTQSKAHLIDKLILCSIAIDCSLDTLNTQATIISNTKTSMKSSLRKWLIQHNYAFDNVVVNNKDYERISEDEREGMFVEVSEILPCSSSFITSAIAVIQSILSSAYRMAVGHG